MLDVQTYYEQGIAADKVAPGAKKHLTYFLRLHVRSTLMLSTC